MSGERERSGRGAGRSSGGTFIKTSHMSRKASSPLPLPPSPSMFALNTHSASRQGVVLTDLQSLVECQ